MGRRPSIRSHRRGHLSGNLRGRCFALFSRFSAFATSSAAPRAASGTSAVLSATTLPSHRLLHSFSGTIQVKSIDTGNERRDAHLQNADFFEAETYPTITFESTEVTSTGENTLSAKGKLTMHGTTKEVTLPIEILGTGINPRGGKAQIGLETNFSILCSDYGVNSWERFSAVLGDEVKIQVLIEANAE